MRIEVSPGVELHVEDLGAGRPVVLVAGFGLSHPVWDREVRELCEAGFRAVCIDLRGTGLSDKPMGDHSMERHALDVAAVMTALDLRDAVFVGWSFGGQVALQLTTVAADRLAALVLVSSHGVRASRSEEFPFLAPAGKLLPALVAAERADRIASRRKTLESGFAAPPSPDVVDFLLRLSLLMPSWASVAWYSSYLETDMVDLLPQISLPVLQLLGEEDPVTDADAGRWVDARLSDGRIVTLDGCGHYPMFEAPAAFDAALIEFVRSV